MCQWPFEHAELNRNEHLRNFGHVPIIAGVLYVMWVGQKACVPREITINQEQLLRIASAAGGLAMTWIRLLQRPWQSQHGQNDNDEVAVVYFQVKFFQI